MRILEGRTGTGFTISGESVMIDKYGEVYPTIDNLMHPNPGLREDGYPEIERCIDWMYRNNLVKIRPYLDKWILRRVAEELDFGSMDSSEIIKDIMYCDLYTPYKEVINQINTSINFLSEHPDMINDILDEPEISISDKIVTYLNETFLRVRAGGKFNPEGADSIYFRISSHNYNWGRVITDFLWDTFKSVDKMPKRIWIGHDAETNPPEVVLYDGSPEELFDKYDSKIFENINKIRSSFDYSKINKERVCYILNKKHYLLCKSYGCHLYHFI